MNLRPSRTALVAMTAVALAAPQAAAAKSSACDHAHVRPGQASDRTLARSAVCLLNRQRARRGLRKLRLNRRLSKAARFHTRDMVRRNYFSHTSRAGRDVVDRLSHTGYMRGARRWMVGENLAWGSGGRGTPAEIVQAWMHSPGHRHNILQRRFREIGIGVEQGAPIRIGSPAATYTTTFGARG